MPFAIDRRSFLKQSAAAAALGAFGSQFTWADRKDEQTTRIALLSDIHIAADPNDSYRGFYPSQNLRRVLQQVSASQFDTMLINGDLARLEGKPADYSAIASHLEPVVEKLPLLITLGNHDNRKSARNGITDFRGAVQPVEKKLVMTFDAGPMSLVLLDSLMVTNIAAGQLGHSQREWLNQEIHSLGKPAVIFVHHNLDLNDDNALVDARALLDILRPATLVKAIAFGHTHAWRHTQMDGLHLVNVPAVAYNFEDTEPIGWVEAAFTDRSAKLRLHAIGGNTAVHEPVLDLTWR
jgi:3',5'-cyclic AMP phosphodiesterase CpdA